MSRNLFAQFAALIPQPPLQSGAVTAVSGGIITVTLPGGGTLSARGSATVGQNVFVRDGVIEGVAPALTAVLIEV
jgi:hypothetical protein